MEKFAEMIKEDFEKRGSVDDNGNIFMEGSDGTKTKIGNIKKDKAEEVRDKFIACIIGKHKDWGEASEILTNYIKSEMNIYTTKDDNKTEIWIYREGIYVPNGKCEIKEFLRKLLDTFYSAYIYNLVVNKIEPDTFIDSNTFFNISYPHVIAVKNGILDINTLKLEPFTPKKIFFNKLPVDYNPDATCPHIEQFLKEVLANEEDIKVIEEYLGFSLMDDYYYEKALMLHGDGRNGKGKTIELFKRLFGMDNCSAIPLTSLRSDDFCVSELFGKRLNLAGDIGHQDLKDTSMFKSLTGRDMVSGKRKFMANIPFRNNAKFIFACNELPMVYDTSRGFWARWILLDFPHTFVSEREYENTEDKTNMKIKDDFIIDKISTDDELSGLLNLALVGLARLKMNKGFSSTKGSEEIKQIWIRKSNSFMAFALDCLEETYEGRIKKKALRKRYVQYCKDHKVTPKTDYVIKRVIQEQFGGSEAKVNIDMQGQVWCWEGIKFREVKNE